jgi:8-amino-7-oxononanoate synthase
MTATRPDPARARRCAPPDPFGGFFDRPQMVDPGDGLLDIEVARAWLGVVGWGARTGLYAYQAPLDGRSGPRVTIAGQEMLMLSAYDYLGLIGHPAVEAAAVEAIHTYGTGTGGVRLLSGTAALHTALEQDLAAFKGTDMAAVFSSGYAAAIGAIGALVGPRDLALLDSHVHRSTVEGCRMARVQVRRFKHNDPDALERQLKRRRGRGRVFIMVDGIYSMDGDICPLPDLVALKQRYGAFLVVDEAHSFGVLGASGRGVDEHWGLAPDAVDLWLGSLSKAIPSNGGFVAGSKASIVYLQHGASTFMFSAALCPPATAAARAALQVLRAEPGRRERLRRNSLKLKLGLDHMGFDTGRSETAIIPVMVGGDQDAYRLARRLFGLGVVALAVVPPAVPSGTARLRLCATAAHQDTDLDEALAAFAEARTPEPVSAP